MSEPTANTVTRKGRRSPALARELATGRERSNTDDQGYDEENQDVVHTVGSGPEAETLIGEEGDGESDMFVVTDNLVSVKITHEFPSMDGGKSWLAAGITHRLEPGADPVEALSELHDALHAHLLTKANEGFPTLVEMQDAMAEEVARRTRNRRISRA